jgi:hypothetical protein
MTTPPKVNENCLKGYACPECGSLGPFGFDTLCSVLWSDEGTGDASGFEIDENGYGCCQACSWDGRVKEFRI